MPRQRDARPGKDTASRRTASPEPHLTPAGREVQRFGTLRLAPIALSAEARAESSQLLNGILTARSVGSPVTGSQR
jgi:hypothetical protein